MSKTIVIEQSGTAATLTDTAVVRTPAMDAGNVDWVPSDEFPTAEIGVVENGIYKASDRGVYAFTKVDVNVPASYVTGKKSDGNKYTISVDENGNLVETKLPARIEITTPPTFTGPYFVGGSDRLYGYCSDGI